MKKAFLLLFVVTLSLNSKSQVVTEVKDLDTDTLNKVYSAVEYEAEFPGGSAAWIKYLQKKLKADIPVKQGAPNGTYRVVVKFIVSKDGLISDIVAETSFGYGMENEVKRVIQSGPKWIPAYQNGRNVNAYRRQPITFVVSGK